eukprot:105548-Pleurochrysis_carterae.AAC.1
MRRYFGQQTFRWLSKRPVANAPASAKVPPPSARARLACPLARNARGDAPSEEGETLPTVRRRPAPSLAKLRLQADDAVAKFI